ncbi:MAG TPA: hypothetical protein VGM90_17565 [Kofleriaceae bacterium]|jgi:hypothetical protein
MKLSALLIGVALLCACEKSSGGSAGAAVGSDEKAFLQYLPAGESALVGGNYLKFQDWMNTSPLGKLVSKMSQASPGLTEWTTCFAQFKSVKMLSGVKVAGGAFDMRLVMSGVTVDDIKGCADKAKYTAAVDADKKWVAITMPNPVGGAPLQSGYFVLPNNFLYMRQSLSLAGGATVMPMDRKALEADIAGLSSGTAEKDTGLLDAMKTVDRTKPIWVVGNATGTPLADKIGAVKGWIDITGGIALDASVEIKDKAMADKIIQGVPQMKQQAGALGGALGDVVKSLDVTKEGNAIRFKISISNDQLQKLMDQVGPMMGGMLGGH